MGLESENYAGPEADRGRCRQCGRVLVGGGAHRQYCNAACRARASQGRLQAQIEDVLTDIQRLAQLLRRKRRQTG